MITARGQLRAFVEKIDARVPDAEGLLGRESQAIEEAACARRTGGALRRCSTRWPSSRPIETRRGAEMGQRGLTLNH